MFIGSSTAFRRTGMLASAMRAYRWRDIITDCGRSLVWRQNAIRQTKTKKLSFIIFPAFAGFFVHVLQTQIK